MRIFIPLWAWLAEQLPMLLPLPPPGAPASGTTLTPLKGAMMIRYLRLAEMVPNLNPIPPPGPPPTTTKHSNPKEIQT